MQPDFGCLLVYVFIPSTDDPHQQHPAELFPATSLGNIQPAGPEGQTIDLNVEGFEGLPIQTLYGVPAFQAGQQHSGWRYYTEEEMRTRGWK